MRGRRLFGSIGASRSSLSCLGHGWNTLNQKGRARRTSAGLTTIQNPGNGDGVRRIAVYSRHAEKRVGPEAGNTSRLAVDKRKCVT